MIIRVAGRPLGAGGRHTSTEEAGECTLLSVLTADEQRTLADLLRRLVLAVESGAATGADPGGGGERGPGVDRGTPPER